MRLPEICIRRPVFATVMSLLLTLIGAVAYDRLTVREYPRIEEPVVTVRTDYPGASAEIIESQVTQPLEESLAGIEGIDFMSSISRPEESQITIQFNIDRDPDIASNDVRDRVARARRALPDDVDEPVVAKREADAQPIIWMSLESDRHSSLELSDAADRIVKDRLQSLPGISEIRIFGERRYAMRVWVDPVRLAAYGLTVQDVETALRAQNVEIPAGRIESSDREFTVLAETDLRSQTAFEDIVLRETGGYPVRISDVGHVKVDAEDKRVAFRINGKTGVGVGVIKQSTANPLEVSKAIRQELPGVSASLPEGMRLSIAYDTSIFIERSIYAVVESILIAALLVVLVIFVFLRSVRATLIPMVTIPVSMITTFALMFLFGFSINTLTLLAFVLAVGLVVDDAIVMLENIHRHIEEGMQPFAAAIKGSREIAFACIAMTLTLAAVYAPVSFQTGRTGRLFAEFALTLAGAVLVSGFVALSLSPMMCSKLLRHQERHNFLYRWIEWGLNGLTSGYRRLLARVLSAWPVMLAIYFVLAGTAAGLFLSLPKETAPTEDRGAIIGFAYAPEGSTLEYMDRYAKQIEKILGETKDVSSFGVVQGNPTVTRAVMFLRLEDWELRDRKQQEIREEVEPKLRALPGVMAFVNNPASLGQSGFGQPISLVVQTTESYETLNGYVQEILKRARGNPLLSNLRSDLELNKPEIKISVDRDKVADLGLDVAVVGRTLETMLGGRQVTRYKYAGKQYDVIVQTGDDNRRTPDQLANIYIRSATGDMIPLSSVAQLRETVSPKELNRFNKLRAATITSSVPVGSTLGQGLEALEQIARNVLPPASQIDYAGQSRDFKEASAAFFVTFALSVIFIYLVLAAQFESFIDPLVIMLTVLLAMTGALATLKLTGGTMNIYSQIGMITLVGLITKHGILIVDFANQSRERGTPVREALLEAAGLRLRPILMTTGAMVLGAIPLAVATGAGAESRRQIGQVIVGGLTFGTVFTLFVVPVAYILLTRWRRPTMAAAAEPATPQPAE
ncbi:MAG TPA: efflux RND transporter permease subunit [Verrucomicrobiae bacterium]|nr:efflux RND transporter permease subunit [Verrucomicrobiae bacterium]